MNSESSNRPKLIGLLVAAAVLAIAVLVVLLTSNGDGSDRSATASSDCREVEKPAPKTVKEEAPKPGQVVKRGEPANAVVETSCGAFTIALDTEGSPKTANSFAYLAQAGVFDDTFFHRIVPDFVIQGGDPQGTGMGGPGYKVTEAPPQGTRYEPGVVAMAKAGNEPAGTSGSQFFVVTGSGGASLTPDYAVVGRVEDGMDVVEQIGGLGGPDEQPTQIVVIDSVEIEKG